MKECNVYDFDHTIYAGDSSKDFYIFCLKRKPTILFCLPRFLYQLILYLLGECTKEALKATYFRFLSKLPNVSEYVTAFWVTHTRKIEGWYHQCRDKNDIIISASPEFLLKPLCDQWRVSLVATLVNQYTGEFLSKNCYGKEKLNRFYATFSDVSIQKFYSDSLSDHCLAEISGEAYLVQRKERGIIPWPKN